jgi:DNA-binding transcriptional regulator YiaG
VKAFTCSKCGGDTRVIRGEYDLSTMGIPVLVVNMKKAVCTQCGNVDPIIARMDDLMRTAALAVVCTPSKLRGSDVRFLRKYVGKTAEEFARIISVDKTTLSKWENNHDPVGDQSDRLIRFAVIGLGDGLEEKLKALVENLPQIGTYKPANITIDLEKMSYEYA